jgi:hypothetical protein
MGKPAADQGRVAVSGASPKRFSEERFCEAPLTGRYPIFERALDYPALVKV